MELTRGGYKMELTDIEEIIENKVTRFFVIETYVKAINRDMVDSIYDLKLVLAMLECRYNNTRGVE